MTTRLTRIVECIVARTGALLVGSAWQNSVAQDSSNPPYLNPKLSPEQRATDLVHRMTLVEKASDMANLTYRFFAGKPLYPFGYGLSYTKFRYSDLNLSTATNAAGQPPGAM